MVVRAELRHLLQGLQLPERTVSAGLPPRLASIPRMAKFITHRRRRAGEDTI